MFESELQAKFKKIFGVQKVTFDMPSEMKEQDCLFVEVENSSNTFGDGIARAYVTGKAFIYSQTKKMPFGFFSKQIEKASAQDTKGLFFSDFESNTKYYQNEVQRGFNFVYFYKGQYDPEHGQITEINLNVEET